MQFITNLLTKIDELVWGLPLICLLLGTGIYFTCKLKLLQLTKLKLAFSCIFKKQDNDEGDVSSFQALCTALSSTIGTGNIVGCLLYTSPSPRDRQKSRMPSSA